MAVETIFVTVIRNMFVLIYIKLKCIETAPFRDIIKISSIHETRNFIGIN